MRRKGTIGPVLPTSAKGHCGFVTSWAVHMCGAPATTHYLIDPESNMFACADHAGRVVVVFPPVDRHPVASECVHPEAEWQLSAGHTGFCFVPVEDAVFVSEFEKAGTR